MMLYINQRWYWHYDLSVESDSSPQKREQNALATVVLESRHNRSSVSSVGSLLSRTLNLPRLLTKYHTQSLAASHTLPTLWHHKPPTSMRFAYTHLFTVPRVDRTSPSVLVFFVYLHRKSGSLTEYVVLRTLACLNRNHFVALAAKYGSDDYVWH